MGIPSAGHYEDNDVEDIPTLPSTSSTKLMGSSDNNNSAPPPPYTSLNASYPETNTNPSSHSLIPQETFQTETAPSGQMTLIPGPGAIGGPNNMDDLDAYVLTPAPQGTPVRCRISRDKKGVDRNIYPTYYLHMEREDGKKTFLLAARRRKKSTRLIIYCQQTQLIFLEEVKILLESLDQKLLSEVILSFKNAILQGKRRQIGSNFMGTQFTIFDKGLGPQKPGSLSDGSNIREELAAVLYDTNVLGFKGPRKMTVVIPGMSMDHQRVAVRPRDEHQSILERFKRKDMEDLLDLHNKTPVWNDGRFINTNIKTLKSNIVLGYISSKFNFFIYFAPRLPVSSQP
ncbi:putative tubby-related protein 3 [Apostichopus japonicus]|uniref:Putative tubby-related protein 3 n=1 Tax=Stichopus japonicus TaxID=307972 RepID=A0A2G8JEW4_STIJA|nr:putative tubby-related protein 3 [Apostichopus japonicus]